MADEAFAVPEFAVIINEFGVTLNRLIARGATLSVGGQVAVLAERIVAILVELDSYMNYYTRDP